MERAEQVASDLQFWARRYAEGRETYVAGEVNKLTEKLVLLGVECTPETAGERLGSIWAYDGDPRCCNAEYYENLYGKDGKKERLKT